MSQRNKPPRVKLSRKQLKAEFAAYYEAEGLADYPGDYATGEHIWIAARRFDPEKKLRKVKEKV